MEPARLREGVLQLRSWRRRHRLVHRLVVAAATAISVFTATGFLAAPPVIRHVGEQRLSELLGRKVTIGRVRLNPFALSLTVERFQVLEADGSTPFVSFRRLYVNAELASSIRRGPVLREIRLESPRVHIERRQETSGTWADLGAYNFSDIVARLSAADGKPASPQPPSEDDGAPPRFSLHNIRVIDGAITFEDRPLHARHEIGELSVGVPFISTLPVDVDTFVAPGLSLQVDGTPFELRGRSKPFKDTLESVIGLRIAALDLPRYLPYLPLPIDAAVESGRLTVALDISFARPQAEPPRVSIDGRVALSDLAVRERAARGAGRPLMALGDLVVTVTDAEPLARRFPLDEVRLSRLEVDVRRLANGTLNLQHLLRASGGQRAPAPATVPAVPEPGTWFQIRKIRIDDSTLRFRDEATRPPFEATVEDIALSIDGLTNTRGAKATMAASLHARPGGHLVERGSISLEPLGADGTISLSGIEPRRFAPYYDDQVAFEIVKGTLDLGAGYEIASRRDGLSVRVRDGFFALRDLAVRLPGAREELARIPELAARGVSADVDKRTLSIAELRTQNGRLRVARDQRGVVDMTTLVKSAPPPAPTTTRARLATPPAPAPSSPAWTLALDRLDVQGWAVRFDDRGVDPAATMTMAPIDLHATSLSTAPGSRGNVALRLGVNKKGRVAVTGPVGLDPPLADLRVDVRGLEIAPFRSYLHEQVSLLVTSGTLALKGQARVELPREGVGGRPPELRLRVAGDVDVNDLATVDGDKKEELVRWKALHVGGLKISTPPVAVTVREVALTDLGARLTVFPDAHFNLEDALAKPKAATSARPPARAAKAPPASKEAAAATTASAGGPPPKISVGQVTIAGGQIVFTDRTVQPSYSLHVTELSGRIAGLSPGADTRAEVDIRGRLDDSGTLSVAGQVNPLAKDLFLDMRADVTDFDLTPASSYSGKYVGYGLAKGKLSLAIAYQVASRKLDAKNHVRLDQLTFGDKVRSPDAVKLPVRLAVALLKDRHGVIDVDLPLSGSLDDPKFKVWPLVWQVVSNLVVKAATAPFSLIASAFGGGDELSYVEFPAGLATLDGKGRDKLGSLAKALRERRELSFEIQGGADPGRDREGLRRERFEQKLRAQKVAELVREGATVGAVDNVRYDANERPRLLAAAYKAETFQKPRNLLGFAKSLPDAEMEKLMLANLKIDDEDMRTLAGRRAATVKEALAKLAPGQGARLYLVSPRLGDRANRVDFKLKME